MTFNNGVNLKCGQAAALPNICLFTGDGKL